MHKTLISNWFADKRIFAMELIKKQCQDFLLPKCEIKLSIKLGEGMYITYIEFHTIITTYVYVCSYLLLNFAEYLLLSVTWYVYM